MKKIILAVSLIPFSFMALCGISVFKTPEVPFSDRPIVSKKTYAALFSSANGLLGVDVDVDRMSDVLKEMGVSSVVIDKTATVEEIIKLTSVQARQAEQDNADLFLFFSGHGTPYNLVLDDAYFSMLRWLRYIDNAVSADVNVTIFLDTCYAGSIFDVIKKSELKHVKNIIIAASSESNAVSPDFGEVFGGAFTGSFYMSFKTFRMRNPFSVPTWGNISGGVYKIYRFVAPGTHPVFLEWSAG